MKILAGLMIFSSMAFAITPMTQKTAPAKKEEVKDKKMVGDKASKIMGKEEDCDDKAKKPIEIKPESISLGGGTAGCTIE